MGSTIRGDTVMTLSDHMIIIPALDPRLCALSVPCLQTVEICYRILFRVSCGMVDTPARVPWAEHLGVNRILAASAILPE